GQICRLREDDVNPAAVTKQRMKFRRPCPFAEPWRLGRIEVATAAMEYRSPGSRFLPAASACRTDSSGPAGSLPCAETRYVPPAPRLRQERECRGSAPG